MSHILVDSPTSSLKQLLLIVADYGKLKISVESNASGEATPTLITPDKMTVKGYLPALMYMCRTGAPSLLGQHGSPLQEAQVYSLLMECDHHLLLPLNAYGHQAQTKTESPQTMESVSLFCRKTLDPLFLKQTFAVGERLTLADLVLAYCLQCLLTEDQRQVLLKSLEHVPRWFKLITHGDIMKKHLAVTPPTPASSEKPVKKGNALDELPESSFVLDTWKRQYSNDKNLRECSMPWFWKHYDPQGYSLWHMRYEKTPDENTVDYATANMLSGFLQRLDNNFRKYSFAVLNVIGEKGDFDIVGLWLIRGQEIPAELKEHPSFPYYSFKRLNHEEKPHQQLIEDYWCNDEILDNRPISCCKVWK